MVLHVEAVSEQGHYNAPPKQESNIQQPYKENEGDADFLLGLNL